MGGITHYGGSHTNFLVLFYREVSGCHARYITEAAAAINEGRNRRFVDDCHRAVDGYGLPRWRLK